MEGSGRHAAYIVLITLLVVAVVATISIETYLLIHQRSNYNEQIEELEKECEDFEKELEVALSREDYAKKLLSTIFDEYTKDGHLSQDTMMKIAMDKR